MGLHGVMFKNQENPYVLSCKRKVPGLKPGWFAECNTLVTFQYFYLGKV